MTISSMTGFARQTGEFKIKKTDFSWFFEIKSVNGLRLEVRTRFPSFLESASMPAKSLAEKYFARGNVQVFLDFNSSSEEQEAVFNETLLLELMDKASGLYKKNENVLQKPSVSELFSVRGVVELKESKLSEEDIEALKGKLLESFEKACKALQKDRRKEGEKIQKALLDIVKKIEDNVGKIEKIEKTLPKMLEERLSMRIKELGTTVVSEDRLAQEVAFLIARADIKEEIDRLKAHLKTAKELLKSDDPVGRRLDFLCQELNREANTTCSKSSDIELTNIGMALKALIEQFREQVQNIE